MPSPCKNPPLRTPLMLYSGTPALAVDPSRPSHSCTPCRRARIALHWPWKRAHGPRPRLHCAQKCAETSFCPPGIRTRTILSLLLRYFRLLAQTDYYFGLLLPQPAHYLNRVWFYSTCLGCFVSSAFKSHICICTYAYMLTVRML